MMPDLEAKYSKPTFERSIQYIIKRRFGVRLRDGKIGKGNWGVGRGENLGNYIILLSREHESCSLDIVQ